MGAFSQKELEYLRGQMLGRLATVSRKQNPQLTAVGFVADEERIYLWIKHDSVKARNIRRNPRVSFLVDDYLGHIMDPQLRRVSVSGTAELISSGKLHEIGRDLILEKYPPDQVQDPQKEEWGDRILGWSKYILVITPIKVRSWGLT
ncbi:MAG: pyridoxamine 5'-phosphate oxidase family protein [Candidatus Hermodarchaeia archaeon]|jgi:PPOX class F420-dependent enzyme/OxyR family protein